MKTTQQPTKWHYKQKIAHTTKQLKLVTIIWFTAKVYEESRHEFQSHITICRQNAFKRILLSLIAIMQTESKLVIRQKAILFRCFFKISAILKSVTNIDQNNSLRNMAPQPFSVRAELLSTRTEIHRTRHVRYITYLLTYLRTYLLHGAESFLRS